MASVANLALTNIKQNSGLSSLFLFVLLVASLSACQQAEEPPTQLVFSGPMMGTEYRVTVVSSKSEDAKGIEADIVNAMTSVNNSMSNYLSDSEISKFNRLPAGELQTISPDFAAVVEESESISELSGGTFDITLARAIDAWGFGPDGHISQQPSNQAVERLRATTGYQKLSLVDGQLSKLVDGVEISLSAIAKGYAVDKVAWALEARGEHNFLVNIGGELRASGTSVSGEVWRVGIEKPHVLGGIQQIALLKDASIATSGDYRNYLVVDGQQFSHTIDPISLKPVLHKMALVSVISANASTADALATAMMAMDENSAWSFAQQHNLAAYLIIRNGNKDEFLIQVTEEFKAYLQ